MPLNKDEAETDRLKKLHTQLSARWRNEQRRRELERYDPPPDENGKPTRRRVVSRRARYRMS